MRTGPLVRLVRACHLAAAGRYGAARHEVEQALAPGNSAWGVDFVAGLVLFTTRDYQRAVECLQRAVDRGDPVSSWARRQLVDMVGALGWEHDVRRVLEAAILAEPEQARWHALAVRLFVRGHDWSRALAYAQRALTLVPEHASLWMEVAGLHARQGDRPAACGAVAQALQHMRPEQEGLYRREAVRVAIDAGDFELARQSLERLRQLEPESAELLVQRAEWLSWQGDRDAARAWTEAALARVPGLPAGLRIQGALAVMAGRYESAVALLRRAIDGDSEDYQAYVWLAEACLWQERYDEAHAQLDHAIAAAEGPLLVAWVLRFLVVARENRRPGEILTANRTEEFGDMLRELCPARAERALSTMRVKHVVSAAEAALVALRGNRSTTPTHVVDGVLTRLTTRTGCRHQSRWALQLLRVASGEECRQHFERIIPRYPGSSLAYCHRGELYLWLGDKARARADLEKAISIVEGTRWAFMGLSMLALLDGDDERCLRINAHGVKIMRGSEGPAIHVYRGEALRGLGRVDEAIAELEIAVRLHPSRVGATINLALAYVARGAAGDPERFVALWRRLFEQQAPGLLCDAAYELGVTLVGDEDWQPELATKVAVLERALAMMGGNRSSGLATYHTADGALRFVPRWPASGAGPHARDQERLRLAERVALAGLARK
ncbi:MAG: tetratricopeptide repeat protein [Myxococcota bacterium]